MSERPDGAGRDGARPNGALSALGFLTVLGRATAPTPAALLWFGPVGALVGGLVGLVWWGAGNLWSALVAAALAVAADLLLTGMLHLDGLADSADGLLPHLDRARRLEVMARPDVGAFAVGTVGIVLLLRVGGVAALPASWRAVAFAAGTWAAARTLMVAGLTRLPYARANGIASGFRGAGRPAAAPLGVGLVVALAGAIAGRGAVGAVAVGGGLLAGIGVLALARRRLGGYTGDVLGATGVLAETVALVVAAARW